MTVTKRGGAWFGTERGDIEQYLRAFAAGGYAVQHVVHSTCRSCGRTAGFKVLVDDDEGAAVRRCAACDTDHVMLDSADYLDEAELVQAACPCRHEQFDVAVGFSMREGDEADEVRWVYVGLRCQNDGLLGVYADWKIDYSPSEHLLRSA